MEDVNKRKERQKRYLAKMDVINIRISPDDKQFLQQWAKDSGENLSTMIKRLLTLETGRKIK